MQHSQVLQPLHATAPQEPGKPAMQHHLRCGMAYAGTMRPKGRTSGAGEHAQVSPGGTGIVWQQPSVTLPDSETTNTPTRVRQFLKKGVVKFQEVSPPLHLSLCRKDLQWRNALLCFCRTQRACAVLQTQLLQQQLHATVSRQG